MVALEAFQQWKHGLGRGRQLMRYCWSRGYKSQMKTPEFNLPVIF